MAATVSSSKRCTTPVCIFFRVTCVGFPLTKNGLSNSQTEAYCIYLKWDTWRRSPGAKWKWNQNRWHLVKQIWWLMREQNQIQQECVQLPEMSRSLSWIFMASTWLHPSCRFQLIKVAIFLFSMWKIEQMTKWFLSHCTCTIVPYNVEVHTCKSSSSSSSYSVVISLHYDHGVSRHTKHKYIKFLMCDTVIQFAMLIVTETRKRACEEKMIQMLCIMAADRW